MHVLIIGAGIGGLSTALSLHAAGVECVIVESARELRPIGVGINLQPHAVRELAELGLAEELRRTGIQTQTLLHTTSRGQAVLTLPRGTSAGYHWPHYSIHRGRLQALLARTVRDRLGSDVIRLGLAFEDFEQDGAGVTAVLRDVRTGEIHRERADVLVGADGVRSTLRARLHPEEGPFKWNGLMTWRGLTERKTFLDGATMLVAGGNRIAHPGDDAARDSTGAVRRWAKLVAYAVGPGVEDPDAVMVNWSAVVTVAEPGPLTEADWYKEGRLADCLPDFAGWVWPELDVPRLLGGSEQVLVYPMVDRDPVPFWGTGRVTLLGDAAHPMYPVGSNGGSQAILDARVLARALATAGGPAEGVAAYEAERVPATSALVLNTRDLPIDATVLTVEERAPQGFADVADVLSAEELAEMHEAQKRITDMDVRVLNERPTWTVD